VTVPLELAGRISREEEKEIAPKKGLMALWHYPVRPVPRHGGRDYWRQTSPTKVILEWIH
jgi:hypothetical protein